MPSFKLFLSGLLLIGLTACATTEETKNVEGNTADIYLQLGVRYLNLNKLEIARENLLHAIRLDSKNAQAFNALAFLDEKLNKIDDARTHYQTAITLTPDDLGVKNNYGRFLCEQGEAEKGMALLTAATNDGLNERPWLAMTNLGRCYMQLAQYQDAETYFSQALQLNSNYAPALLEMQKVNYQQGNFMAAKVYLQRYAQVSDPTPESLLIAVQIEGASGNAAMAKHYQSLLLTKFPLSAEAKRFKSIK
ncbi:MAG: type IV pilus biogenesis/stability protein PilW [Methylococcales bacterium]|nr:type IV pilus biogenesis/stability protein PilW [Methylococcales bacterium]MDD5754941.1 type IV pilus biogenesis/stability protein PilW [Methylococcales bacterium]